MYNQRSRGLQNPGQYALFLDGEDIGRGSFDGLFERKEIGNCSKCPNGTEPFSMMMLTCGPMDFAILRVIDQSENVDIVHQGSTVGMHSDPNVYSSCVEQSLSSGIPCSNPALLFYNTCLDPSECYAFNVASPNLQQAFAELELGGKKTKTDPISSCAGSSVLFGNEAKCPQ